MNDMTPDELALASGGVPIRGGLTSAADVAEEEEEEEEEEDTLDPPPPTSAAPGLWLQVEPTLAATVPPVRPFI